MKAKKTWKVSKEITGTRTGYKVIDSLFNGLQLGELMLIGGRPMMGKNTLSLNIAMNVSKRTEKKVLFFDSRNGRDYVERWFLSYLSGIPIWDMYEWDFSLEQWERFIHATEVYRKLKIEPKGTNCVEYIIERCEELSKKDELGLVIIDYLQIIKKNDKDTYKNPNAVLSELKALAKRLQVPIIVITSLREKMTRRIDKRPCAKDLKNMGISEEYWDNALLLHRKDDDLYSGVEEIELVALKSFMDIDLHTCLYLNHDNLHFEDIDSDIFKKPDEKIFKDYETEIEEENRQAEEDIMSVMKECLDKNGDDEALRCADKLREINYYSYSDEIEDCYKTCAKRGNIKALLYMEDKFRKNGAVCEEEFDILKQLTDQGYTMAFGRIADCYLNGIGCEKDRGKALINYINGSVYWDDTYCENMIEENFRDEKEWNSLSSKITDLYMYDWHESKKARLRLGNDIFEGKIKEFQSGVAYYIYKGFYLYDSFYDEMEAQYCSIPCLNFAKCLLYGIGTSVKPNVVLAVLKDALHSSEWERNAGDLSAFDRIEEIETMFKEIEDTYGKIESEYTDEEFDFYNEEDAFLGEMPYLGDEDYEEGFWY